MAKSYKQIKSNPMYAIQQALYRNQTRHERAVERVVATLGVPYRFQHLELGGKCNAILDFAFPDLRVALEVDGEDHATPAKRKSDLERSARLATQGWKVVRITNGDVDMDPVGSVKRALKGLLPGL